MPSQGSGRSRGKGRARGTCKPWRKGKIKEDNECPSGVIEPSGWKPPMSDTEDLGSMRRARDGVEYTGAQFIEFYGDSRGLREWQEAGKKAFPCATTSLVKRSGVGESDAKKVSEPAVEDKASLSNPLQESPSPPLPQANTEEKKLEEIPVNPSGVGEPVVKETSEPAVEEKASLGNPLEVSSTPSLPQASTEDKKLEETPVKRSGVGEPVVKEVSEYVVEENASLSNPPEVPPGLALAQVIFSQEELRVFRGPPVGGKAANRKQRELRSKLLAENTCEEDLTNSTFDWRAMLKSLPTGPAIVGSGITKCTFRLLQNVRDHNYIKIDSGERHVFELSRTDGTVIRLHFHKNGRCDPHAPERGDRPSGTGAAEPSDVAGASTWLAELKPPATREDIVTWRSPHERALPLGRNEAAMALDTLLQAKAPDGVPIVINITDEVAFPWRKFLRNLVRNLEIIGQGVCSVYVVGVTEPPFRIETRSGATEPIAALLICRVDSSYVFLRPESRYTREERGDNWEHLDLARHAVYIGQSWMRLRR